MLKVSGQENKIVFERPLTKYFLFPISGLFLSYCRRNFLFCKIIPVIYVPKCYREVLGYGDILSYLWEVQYPLA
jgi:hypothetical protein